MTQHQHQHQRPLPYRTAWAPGYQWQMRVSTSSTTVTRYWPSCAQALTDAQRTTRRHRDARATVRKLEGDAA